LKAARGKQHLTYRGTMQMIVDFSPETKKKGDDFFSSSGTDKPESYIL
jgi:hypothetical protein